MLEALSDAMVDASGQVDQVIETLRQFSGGQFILDFGGEAPVEATEQHLRVPLAVGRHSPKVHVVLGH